MSEGNKIEARLSEEDAHELGRLAGDLLCRAALSGANSAFRATEPLVSSLKAENARLREALVAARPWIAPYGHGDGKARGVLTIIDAVLDAGPVAKEAAP